LVYEGAVAVRRRAAPGAALELHPGSSKDAPQPTLDLDFDYEGAVAELLRAPENGFVASSSGQLDDLLDFDYEEAVAEFLRLLPKSGGP
jgi:hypothetical protein